MTWETSSETMRKFSSIPAVGVAASVALLLEASETLRWPTPVRAAVLAVGVLATVIWLLRARGLAHRFATTGWLVTAIFGLALPLFLRTPTPQAWATQVERRLQRHFEIVRARVLELESAARGLGDRAYEISMSEAPRGPDATPRLFDVVDSLAHAGAPSRQASSWGIRIIGANGELLAWAGTTLAAENGTRMAPFSRGPREVYFRRASIGTFLVYDRQDGRADTTPADSVSGLRVVVETPVSTTFERPQDDGAGWDLAAELSTDIDVQLHYETRLLPPYLTQKNLEIHGDFDHGLQADFVIRGDDGAPRLLGRLSAPPLESTMQQRFERLRLAQSVLVLVSFAIAGWTWLRRSSVWWRLSWDQPLTGIVLLWAARALLAWLDFPSPSLTSRGVLNPTAFGFHGIGGLFRTPFDLSFTAAVLLASVLLLFVRRVRQPAAAALLGSPVATGVRTVAAAILVGLAAWTALAIATWVARNTTLPLLGAALDLGSGAVLCIHAALMMGVSAVLVLALLLVSTAIPSGASRAVVAITALGLGVALWLQASVLVAIVGIAVLAAGARLRFLFADERFTSFSVATLVLTGLAATLSTVAIQAEGFRGRQEQVIRRTEAVRKMVDDVRPFVLEHVLRDLAADPDLRRALTATDPTPFSALAFEIWAGSLLRHLDWPCQVRVHDETGAVTSEFSIGLPYSQDIQSPDFQERALAEEMLIEQTEIMASPVGTVRLYRGALPVRFGRGGPARGIVVIDLPFAHESLALAASPHVRSPELLRPGREPGPRVEESELYLLAWLRQGLVVESSSPYLEVGQPLPGAAMEQPGWRRVRLLNATYVVTELPSGERTLIAGFQLLKPLDRLLEWTQVAALDFTAAVVLLLGLVGLGRLRATSRVLPPLLIPKRLGFQQKLMGAFLVVALLPSVVISLATQNIMRERSTSRNRDAALIKARSAEAALADVVRRELQSARESEYVEWYLRHPEWWMQQSPPPARDIPAFSTITIFNGDGRPILDETLSSFSDAEGQRFVTASPRQVFASRDGNSQLNLGALEPVWVAPEGREGAASANPRLCYLYYRRRLTDALLRDLAPILNTDISGFVGPHLVVSSQKSLAAAGLLPHLVPPAAYKSVLLGSNRYAVAEETAGTQRYYAGYLPLQDRFGHRIGALAVQQLLQTDEFAIEVERTRALVVGLSTTMFVLTLALAIAFATRIFDPVRNLIEGTRRIAGGNLAFRLQARAGDEIGELERSFNDMAARLQSTRSDLDARRRYLEAVLDNIASGVVVTDREGRITAANAAAGRILSTTPVHLEGRAWRDLARAAQDPGTRSFWTHVGDAPAGEGAELTLVGERDRVTLRLIVTSLRPEADAESLGRVAIFEDLTELIRSKKLAAWAEMARQVAHEIKNPLTPLKLSAQFMQQAFHDRTEKFPEIFTDGMQTIVQQVDVLRRIASEFSDFGRMQTLEPKPMDLGALLRRVTAPYRGMQGIVLDLEPGDTTFPGDGISVLGDEEGLRKVFTNVMENAREAMNGKGRILLCVAPSGDGSVQVLVADEGTGLTAEAHERLFEPYFSTKNTGTGLGLAITRSILDKLGGSISLVNRTGGGAEVRVTLSRC